MVMHDDNPTGFKVGSTYKQGELMATEGTARFVIGNHLHIEVGKVEVGKGKYNGQMYNQNKQGVFHILNNMPIENVCFMDSTEILKGNANWKYLIDVPVSTEGATSSTVGGIYKPNVANRLTIRSQPSLQGDVVTCYKRGEGPQEIKLDEWDTIVDGYVWGRYTNGQGQVRYVAIGKNSRSVDKK